ncbi:MAG: hypothetical protein Q9224_007313, partial [Gallowayella concinna]
VAATGLAPVGVTPAGSGSASRPKCKDWRKLLRFGELDLEFGRLSSVDRSGGGGNN